jgi:tetratricopeptide (TPR) repeat protein
MLETIRQFAEEQLIARAEVAEVRTAHASHFAAREAEVLALWDGPRQCEAYEWFTTELANLRTAFRWAADQRNLDIAATIATYAGFAGFWIESFEPIARAGELIEIARAVDHARLAFLYLVASQCYATGRIAEAVDYSEAGQRLIGSGRDEVPYGMQGWLGAAHLFTGQPERSIEWCRAQLARDRDTHSVTRASLVLALAVAGCADEAIITATDLIDAAEATRNPHAISYALLAYGLAWCDADPDRAREALRRGMRIAQDSIHHNESHLAGVLSRLEAHYGDPLASFDYVTLAIRNYHDTGNTINIRSALAVLAVLFDRVGRYESAATIVGFAISLSTYAVPALPEFSTAIDHLRHVLGDQTYESLTRHGGTMATAEMARYAYDQIDEARTALADVSR